MEKVLGEITSMNLGDQDRVEVVIQTQAVQEWLLNPQFGALLVHGNGRRSDPISPASVSCALLIHVFSKVLHSPTLYWFCGLHSSGLRGNPLGMLRSLICQLLCLSCCQCSIGDQDSLDTRDVRKLLTLFEKLLRRSSNAFPVVCILDGLSFYESRHARGSVGMIVSKLAALARSDSPVLILLLSSPTRTTYLCCQPEIACNLTVAEVPDHVCGAKQGLDGRRIISATETRARKLREHLRRRKTTE